MKREYEMNLAGGGSFQFVAPGPRYATFHVHSQAPGAQLRDLNDGDFIRAGELIFVGDASEVAIQKVKVSLTPEEDE